MDLEQIIVDNESTDRTAEVVEEFKSNYGAKITLISERDRGICTGVNKGLRRVEGQLWACLNSDDCYVPYALQRCVSEFRRCAEIEAIYCSLEKVGPRRHVSFYIAPKFKPCYLLMKKSCAGMLQPATILRRSVIGKVGEFDDSFRYASDYDYLIRVGISCRLKRMSIILTKFREHADSSSVRASSLRTQKAESVRISSHYSDTFPCSKFGYYLDDFRFSVLQVRPGNLGYIFSSSVKKLKRIMKKEEL